MKRFITMVLSGVCFVALLHAQDKKPVEVKAPTLTAEQKLAIKDLQLKDARIFAQMKQIESQYKDLTEQGRVNAMQLQKEINDACKSDKVKYRLDPETLTCIEDLPQVKK